jgi:peptidoglycan biosynthesis protein MviN/MurJ (putative lipid II flippase)
MALASAVMGMAVAAAAYLPDWGRAGSWPCRVVRPLLAICLGGGVYLGLAAWLRLPELAELKAVMTRRRS